MRMLIGLGMSLIVAVGAYVSFATRPEPVFAQTRLHASNFGATDMGRVGQRIVAVGELGQVLYSDDEAANWQEAAFAGNRGSSFTKVVFLDAQRGVAVGQDGLIATTQDAGSNWKEAQFDSEASEPMLGVWGLAEGPVFAYGSFGRFFVSEDHGQTWTRRNPGLGEMHFYAMDGSANGRLMLVGEQGLAARSTDYGQTWERIPEFYRGSLFGLARVDDQIWIAYGLRGNVYRTTDFGSTWQQVDTGLTIGLFGHTILADGTVVIVGQGGVVLVSHDQGANFAIAQQNKGANLTAAIPLKNGQLLTASLNGIKTLDQAPKPAASEVKQ